MATPNKETLLDWYRQMVLIRRFEERCAELYQEGLIGGFLHLYIGQEATGVGAVSALTEKDHIITAYRDHGLALARGLDPNAIMAEMLGKRTGVSGGKGGSMHLANRDLHFWGGYGIVGGHLPLAAGIALSIQYQDLDEVVLAFMGDGATNIGYFHESLNLSAVWDLPVVWLIENNQYGMGTAVDRASGATELVRRAMAYSSENGRGMKMGPRLDGMDVQAVHDGISEAVEYARKNGPILVESLTYRLEGHSMGDPQRYRTKEEVESYVASGPIGRFRKVLTEKYKNIESRLDEIDAQMLQVVDDAVEFARNSDDPTYEDLISHVYVD
ncbi:MAG TPA: pyruvate dehydrogenase (acetyl-transferring) E1 component subunit alpha [Aggregatilinea sp.]|jgi:pyruvate dehydrogenase E1 component alpha subunit|uniref:pyruvate dehydrogenase (acetyl-transferring) E1 component subunit alpha n=1 Tax=Aggregatilinea sp. TaxID=2806333 RepID=UPI002BF85C5C|nr:pyruvate dehydrogenase (acetyl-transferring) E1 component subunit alpha [Aggregatilinea sp.]HML23290.1 pyruvate dehydrogenase (acetyl-transferring) E1 component subunit alpha [Aggregatilinea sp.]